MEKREQKNRRRPQRTGLRPPSWRLDFAASRAAVFASFAKNTPDKSADCNRVVPRARLTPRRPVSRPVHVTRRCRKQDDAKKLLSVRARGRLRRESWHCRQTKSQRRGPISPPAHGWVIFSGRTISSNSFSDK